MLDGAAWDEPCGGAFRQLAWLNGEGAWIGLCIEQRARPDGGMDYDAIGVTQIVHYVHWLSRLDRDAGVLQDSVRPEILVEWVYRLLLSFLTLPSNWIQSDAQLRTTLHALLVPVLLK